MGKVFIKKNNDSFEYALINNDGKNDFTKCKNFDTSPLQVVKSKYGNIYILYACDYIDIVYIKMLLKDELIDKLIDIKYLQNDLCFKIKNELKNIYRVLKNDDNSELINGNISIIQNDKNYNINATLTIKENNYYLFGRDILARLLLNNNFSFKEIISEEFERNGNSHYYPIILGNTNSKKIVIKTKEKKEKKEKVVTEDDFICQL